MKTVSLTLENFQGPLELLYHLIQKRELDICELSLVEIIAHFQELPLSLGAEFLGYSASLIWLKSRALLPKEEDLPEETIEDPGFEIIHHLIDYCRFKQAAKALHAREEKAFFREVASQNPKKPLGIDHISLEELAQLFQKLWAGGLLEKRGH